MEDSAELWILGKVSKNFIPKIDQESWIAVRYDDFMEAAELEYVINEYISAFVYSNSVSIWKEMRHIGPTFNEYGDGGHCGTILREHCIL